MRLSNPIFLLSTCFGIGKLPFAPGTYASLFALPLGWLISSQFGQLELFLTAIILFFVGCWVSGLYANRVDQRDPNSAVIDEVVGQLFTLSAVPVGIWSVLGGFLLFRIFDIFKPWPIDLTEKSFAGGVGIMLDDLIASLYAGGLLYVIHSINVRVY